MNCKAMQRTKVKQFRQGLRVVFLFSSCMMIAFFFAIASMAGQSGSGQSSAGESRSGSGARSVISLVSSPKPRAEIVARRAGDFRFENAPANFHVFPAATAGENTGVEELTLKFAGETTLAGIKSTNQDFVIEPGGTCQEGDSYRYGESCSLLVRFNPQGPGHRLGFVRITHSASATPATVGLAGNGYVPVVSFTPARITTVPGTVTSGTGIIGGSANLAVDGGGGLYVADTNDNLIRYSDSSGVFSTIAGGGTAVVSGVIDNFATAVKLNAPYGVAVNGFGTVYITDTGDLELLAVTEYGTIYTAAGGGTLGSDCTVSSLCPPTSISLLDPQQVTIDPSGNVIFQDEGPDEVFASGAGLAYLNGSSDGPGLLVDSDDNLYIDFTVNLGSGYTPVCQIAGQNEGYSYDGLTGGQIWTAVGSRKCGYAGDGGPAINAEIGGSIPQLAMDLAGNLYFSDNANNRVRRVDASTGIIRTIAGNGTAGYSGDGGAATSATLKSPTGVAVNSQGNVYIVSAATSGQVIRQVGPLGYLAFGNQDKGIAGAAQLVTVSNTGNDAMTLTTAEIVGTNKGDFKIDATTTTCILTQGTELNSGQTCRIGVIFTPGAVGARTATLTLLDNTVNGADSVTLTGAGILSTATFKITVPANGASFTSGTAVTFSVSVTAASGGVQPTGTVQFKVDGANHGGVVTLSGTGTASTSLTGLTTASHTLSVTYSGDANYAAAAAISVSITVKAAAAVKLTEPLTTEELSSTSAIDLVGDVTSKLAPAPTGKVMFAVDGKCVATAAIVSGKASATAGKLAAGIHTVRAVYGGDAHHSAATASEEITVGP